MDNICFTAHSSIVQYFGQKIFLCLCKQIFFEGRSETVRQFFERRYNISFPIDITCYYYEDVVNCVLDTDKRYTDIHNSLSKKIEELGDSFAKSREYDFLLMSNICRLLWSNGIEKPKEEKLKELMKKLMYEINFVKSGRIKEITLSNLSDKIENFITLLDNIEEEINRPMVYKIVILEEEEK